MRKMPFPALAFAACLLLAGMSLFAQPGASPATAPSSQPARAPGPSAHLGGIGAAVPPEKPGAEFTAKQNTARLNAWREQIRHILYVPDKLPSLDAKT